MYTLLYLFIDMYTLLYLFIFGCAASLLLHLSFLQLESTGSGHMGFSSCSTGAYQLWLEGPRVCRLQQLQPTGLVALWHVESSQTKDQTHVTCIGIQILIHCTTREVLNFDFLKNYFIYLVVLGLSCSSWTLQCLLQHAGLQLHHVGSSSLTRDQTQSPSICSTESQPLDHHGSPHF